MWTLSGFADEIDPDLNVQCDAHHELSLGVLEFRSAWDVVDLTDQQVDGARRILAERGLQVSSIGSPAGKVNIEDDSDDHLEPDGSGGGGGESARRAPVGRAVIGAAHLRALQALCPGHRARP